MEDRHAGQQGLYEQEVSQQGVPTLPVGQGGGCGGGQPALDLLLRLQGAEAWAGPTVSHREYTTLSEEGTDVMKGVREDRVIVTVWGSVELYCNSTSGN